ncbi:hypothetical protein [Streptomyces alfalfae]|uniref:hypothetical protein n=1 Tax=Streptomyces alfalfae TaxID=1642299 RepID=UPI0028127F0C|nr:hypothetical protein [Streptomyces alfalfae]
MPQPRSPENDPARCADELRAALSLHGITLPSLGVDPLTCAGTYPPSEGLIALGNCNTATARALTAALRKAAPA